MVVFSSIQTEGTCRNEEKENVESSCADKLNELIQKVTISEKKERDDLGPDDFEILKVLGQGGYGKVYHARKRSGSNENVIFAMKAIKKKIVFEREEDVVHAMTERLVLENVKSPFLVELYYAFQTSSRLYLVMEYLAGGELFSLMNKHEKFTEENSRFYLAEIILALEHLHNNHVIYRDLKPDNVMLCRNGHLKLTDFGLCKQFAAGEEMRTFTMCGTIQYMAPEILKLRGHGKEVDLWSFGTLVYDMLVGTPPFDGANREETTRNVLRAKIPLPGSLSTAALDMLKSLLNRNPLKRAGINDLKNNDFFKTVDWKKALQGGMDPPFVPEISGDMDTSLFDELFTNASTTVSTTEFFDDGDAFEGFSYQTPGTAPQQEEAVVFELTNGNTQNRVPLPADTNDKQSSTGG